MFDPNLRIGQVLKNADIVEVFKCGNMGGMRRSRKTNTLVIVSDYTKGLYHDKWIGGVLHYTGMGKSGDQDINWAQNKTLAECDTNGVDVHLFEVIDMGEYIYCGRIELVGKPYTDKQPGDDGKERQVWMFPIRPVPDNNVKKPSMFVFENMEDYKTRGVDVDEQFVRLVAENKKGTKKKCKPIDVVSAEVKVESQPIITIPESIIGNRVKHKLFGEGKITQIENNAITVVFDNGEIKKMGYAFCFEKKLIEMI